MDFGSLFFYFLLRYWRRGPPYALFCVLAGGLVVFGGVDTGAVGAITQIVPEVKVPSFAWERVQSVAPAALLIALVAYVESIALAQHLQPSIDVGFSQAKNCWPWVVRILYLHLLAVLLSEQVFSLRDS